MRPIILALVFAAAPLLHAQTLATAPCPTDNDHGHWFGSAHACELRTGTLPFDGSLRLEGVNGSVEVIGENRGDIALEARVEATAHDSAEAAAIVREIEIHTHGLITATGPSQRGSGWSVSYRLRVPRRLAAEIKTTNAALSLTALDGNIHASTTNGGIRLRDLAGKVLVSTTNGAAQIYLTGSTWQGAGLEVRSTNGALFVHANPDYAAQFDTHTTNGNISGFPASRPGPELHFSTTNGGIRFGN